MSSYVNQRSNRSEDAVRPPSGDSNSYTAPVTSVGVGKYVNVKEGFTINFYNDSLGSSIVGPSGGKGGQANNPMRNGGEYVGTTTGLSESGFIQVNWVNTWWQEAKLINGSGFNPVKAIQTIIGLAKGGERKTESRISWVKASSVIIMENYVSEENLVPNLDGDDNTDPAPDPKTDNTLKIDTTTLGIAALAAAVIFSKKGKKKRR